MSTHAQTHHETTTTTPRKHKHAQAHTLTHTHTRTHTRTRRNNNNNNSGLGDFHHAFDSGNTLGKDEKAQLWQSFANFAHDLTGTFESNGNRNGKAGTLSRQ